MRLSNGQVKVVGEERVVGFRSKFRVVNPFVSTKFEFDLSQAAYHLNRALMSSKNGGTVVGAEAALIAAERYLYWNGYSGRSTRVEVEGGSASIEEIRREIFTAHCAKLRCGVISHDVLSVASIDEELGALKRLGGKSIAKADVKVLRGIALESLFNYLEQKISACKDGPRDKQDFPWDEQEYVRLVRLTNSYREVATLLGKSSSDTQAIVRSFCTNFANRSADQALSSAVSMSEASWALPRWLWAQAAESNISTALKFATRAGIPAPNRVFEAQDLIRRVRADVDYDMAREAARREEELYSE
jgi:hypothetical protein